MTQTQQTSRRTDLMNVPLHPPAGPLELHGYTAATPAGSTSGRHRHPYPTLVYVLAGTYRLEEGEHGEKVTDYRAGDMFSEPAGVVVNGHALTDATLLVILPAEPGKPESEAV